MKKLLFSIISASAIVLAGADFSLSNNKIGKFTFDAPSGKNAVLFFRARIKLPAPRNILDAALLAAKCHIALEEPEKAREKLSYITEHGSKLHIATVANELLETLI